MDRPTEELVVGRPTRTLRRYVDRYIGYRVTGRPGGIHRGLPSRHMTFIVSIGDSIDVLQQSDPQQAPETYRTVVSGLQASAALIRRRHTEEGVAIELTPLGSRALLDMPAAALWNTSVHLSALNGNEELWERMQEADTWDQRFSECDTVLRRMLGVDRVPAELAYAWEVLVASSGQASVVGLAHEVGYSRQHLTRRFTAELGMGPKLAGRILRFERAKHVLSTDAPGSSLAEVAASCGYYDQAHLSRDFAQFAACSPTQWLKEEVPSFQDDKVPTA